MASNLIAMAWSPNTLRRAVSTSQASDEIAWRWMSMTSARESPKAFQNVRRQGSKGCHTCGQPGVARIPLVRIYYIIIKSSFKFNKYCICHEIVFRGFVECTPPLIIIRNFGSLSSYHHPLFVILTRWFSSLKPIFPLNGINKFIIRYKRLESITH